MLFWNLTFFVLAGFALAKKNKHKEPTQEEFLKHLQMKESELGKATDRLVFFMNADAFQEARQKKAGPAALIWDADGCTKSDDTPLGWKFKNSCDRHDFAMRNYKAQGRLNHNSKKHIDQNFKKDLKDQCEKEKSKGPCRTMANIYYSAVRAFGDESKRSLAGRIDLSSLEMEDSNDEE